MKRKEVIPAGTPNDANREYLPEAIKGSDMVVNENGNSSQPYPERLKEYHAVLVDGLEDTWYEYVPESYDPNRKTPLVVSLHGGMMAGWAQAIYTTWTTVADKEGFICVFPDSYPNPDGNRFWRVEWGKERLMHGLLPGLNPSETPEKNHDLQFLLKIIELMKTKYNIDDGRVYMQGMSMGDMMTSTFARHYGYLLAGAAGSGANADPDLLFGKNGELLGEGGHVDMWLSRPELNAFPHGTDNTTNKENLRYWREINGGARIPEISIIGEDNMLFYAGAKAATVFLDIKNRDHGQSLDDAQLVWDYMFSGSRRETDGGITHSLSNRPRYGDAPAVAVASGCDKALFNGELVKLGGPVIQWKKLKYHGLNGGEVVRGEYLCVPLSFAAKICGATYETSEDTLSATLTLPDGRTCAFARGSIGCVCGDHVESMLCEALHRGGELYIPAEWFLGRVLNWHFSTCDGVLYAADHWNVLSAFCADLIRDTLA